MNTFDCFGVNFKLAKSATTASFSIKVADFTEIEVSTTEIEVH
jgi:hypothetical protein